MTPRRPSALRTLLSLIPAALLACGGPAFGDPAPARAADAGSGHSVSDWIDRTASSNGPAPEAGEDCATVFYPPHHSLLLYGGKDDHDVNRNELWELDLDRGTWREIGPHGEGPAPSEDHSLIYDPNGDRLLLYGGENGPATNQLWSFDLRTHHWRSLSDSTTPFREDHSAVFDSRGRRMVVFGGWNHDDTNFWDVRAFGLDPGSPSFGKWTNLSVEANRPHGRSDHAAVYDSLRNRMVIFGGWDKDSKVYLSDTWAYEFSAHPDSAGRWVAIKTRRSHPPKRRHVVGAYDPARNWFLVCGGYGEEGYLNDVWAFDLTSEVWLNVTPGPQPRMDLNAVYDPQTGGMVLYGGDAHLKTKFHDVWEMKMRPDAPIDEMIKDAGKHGRTPGKPGAPPNAEE